MTDIHVPRCMTDGMTDITLLVADGHTGQGGGAAGGAACGVLRRRCQGAARCQGVCGRARARAHSRMLHKIELFSRWALHAKLESPQLSSKCTHHTPSTGGCAY